MKIVVLAGGTSTERDVSLCTGNNVYTALKEKGHDTVLIDLYLGYETEKPLESLFSEKANCCGSISAISEKNPDISELRKLRKDGGKSIFGPNVLALCDMADIVFMALHGSNGEDGRIQAAFDLMGIPYTGTGYLSSAVSMDKGITKQFFAAYGVPTPIGTTLKKGRKISVKDVVGFPCMIKTCCGGSSVGVYKVTNEAEAESALADAFAFENEVVIEQFITGREFSVGVIEGKALPIIEIAPLVGFYDYKNKYQAGSAVETCPAVLSGEQTKEMQGYAEAAYRALGMESYARFDFMMDTRTGKMYCLEANTLPGMTPTSLLPQEAAAIGMSFADLCEHIITVSMKKYEEN
ncbi:MAG: D-alanine--D-alanine ligase [Lachnospiraceae bacterium]